MSCTHSAWGALGHSCSACAPQQKQYTAAQMEPFYFDFGHAMEFSYSNSSTNSAFQEQQHFTKLDIHDSGRLKVYNAHGSLSQLDYSSAVGSGVDTIMGLGIGVNMNMMDLNMNSYVSPPCRDPSGMVSFDYQVHLPLGHGLSSPAIQPSFGNGASAVDSGNTGGSRPIDIPMSSSASNISRATSQPYFTPSPYSNSPGFWSSCSVSPGSSLSTNSIGNSADRINTFKCINNTRPAPITSYPGSPGYSTPPADLTSNSPAATYIENLPRSVRRQKPSRSFDCKKCGKLFTRLADVKRHESSVHDPMPMDCPVRNCVRKGNIGFPRRDHLMEHLRTFHNQDIPKRSGNKKRKASAILHSDRLAESNLM